MKELEYIQEKYESAMTFLIKDGDHLERLKRAWDEVSGVSAYDIQRAMPERVVPEERDALSARVSQLHQIFERFDGFLNADPEEAYVVLKRESENPFGETNTRFSPDEVAISMLIVSQVVTALRGPSGSMMSMV